MRQKNQQERELKEAAQQTLSLKSMFERQFKQIVPLLKTGVEDEIENWYYAVGYFETLKLARQKAATDLDRLLCQKTEQKKKYGCLLSNKPNLFC